MILWVPAISQESFELAYRRIAERLCLPGISDDNVNFKRLVQETLNSERVGKWLMIVDNADDHGVLFGTTNSNLEPDRLSNYLPRSDRGAILFTTRSRKMANALTQSNVLALTDMDKAEAKQLLAGRIVKQGLLDDKTAVDELLELLARLPLAIVQAAAFIRSNDVSVRDYVSLFRHSGADTELFDEPFDDPSRYQELDSTIAKTWHISFEQMRTQDPLAAEYLSFMACIDRVNIPQSLLLSGASMVQQIKALGTLTGYAFVTERLQTVQEPDGDRFFDMHRLVHIASVCWLDRHNERAAWTRTAAARLEELVPYGGHRNKEVWTKYLPHAIRVAGSYSIVDKAASASLLSRVGRCQNSLGHYSAAGATHQEVLSFRQNALGPEHPDTLTSMSYVAQALSRQGKYAEAEKMHRETLALDKKVSGDKHPATLTSMNYVAQALSDQGSYAEAERMHRKTLALRKKVSGDEHPDTLTSMNNVAQALSRQGKYAEAEKIHRKTLALRKKVSGDEHPHTLTSMSSVAQALSKQGKYAEAEKMHRKTLVLRKKVSGDEHPHTLTSMSDVAQALSKQGKYAEAEKMHRETLALDKKVSGDQHPDTLTSMNYVAQALSDQGKYAEAERMLRKTLALRKKVSGDEHPHTLTSMSNVAQVLSDQGKYTEAEKIHYKTLALRKKVSGDEHPHTLTSMSNVARALSDQGKYTEAEKMHRKTLALRKKVLGDEHPHTLMSISDIAEALSDQGKYTEAEKMHRKTLALRKKVLGDEHPDTLLSVDYLTYLPVE
jgi:tetratricopeptide (TPR) repeat protein